MKKITGGALYRKIKMNQRFYFLSIAMLSVFAFLFFGGLFNDALTGIGFAAMIPVLGADGKPELDAEGKVKMIDDGKGPGNAKEFKEFVDGLNLQIKEKNEELKKAIDGKLEQKDIDKIKSEIEEANKAKYKALEDRQVILGTEIEALKQNQKSDKGEGQKKSFIDALKDALEEKKDEISNILSKGGKQSGPLVLDVKAAVTMQTDNTISAVGSASHYTLTSNTGIISVLRKRILTYLSGVSVGKLSVDRPYAMWIEELDEQGTPIFIGEGDAKTQLSVRYEEREKKAKKIAVYGKVTTEMLRYLPQLISYIENNLIRRMDIKTEDQLFNGDDAGDNLKGLIPYATAFDGGVGTAGGDGLVHKVVNPNIYDVLRAVALQVANSYGMPERIFIKTDLAALMDVEKSGATDVYLIPPFKSADGRTIAGMQIIPTVALNSTDYDFVGGDLSVVNVQFLENARIQIGLDGNDFTNNKKTILVEQELVQFVSANDTQVIVKGTVEEAKALLVVV